MSGDQPLPELIGAHSMGKDIDQSRLLAFLSPIFTLSQRDPRLSPSQLSAFERLSRSEREVLIRCLEHIRKEVTEIGPRLH